MMRPQWPFPEQNMARNMVRLRTSICWILSHYHWSPCILMKQPVFYRGFIPIKIPFYSWHLLFLSVKKIRFQKNVHGIPSSRYQHPSHDFVGVVASDKSPHHLLEPRPLLRHHAWTGLAATAHNMCIYCSTYNYIIYLYYTILLYTDIIYWYDIFILYSYIISIYIYNRRT